MESLDQMQIWKTHPDSLPLGCNLGSGIIGVMCASNDSTMLKDKPRELGLSIYSSVVYGLSSMLEVLHSISSASEGDKDRGRKS